MKERKKEGKKERKRNQIPRWTCPGVQCNHRVPNPAARRYRRAATSNVARFPGMRPSGLDAGCVFASLSAAFRVLSPRHPTATGNTSAARRPFSRCWSHGGHDVAAERKRGYKQSPAVGGRNRPHGKNKAVCAAVERHSNQAGVAPVRARADE